MPKYIFRYLKVLISGKNSDYLFIDLIKRIISIK